MDALDHLAVPGADLLARVDTLLGTAGAPAGHPVWPLLRRLRVLPGDALDAVLACRPAPLVAAGAATRTAGRAYDDVRVALAEPVGWRGPAAEAYAAQRRALVTYLGDGPGSLAGRMAATAGYAEAVADWIGRTRAALARTLAEVLGSAEAVTVVTTPAAGQVPGTVAAAEIGVRVLATVAEAYDEVEALSGRWAAELAGPGQRPAVGSVSGADRDSGSDGDGDGPVGAGPVRV
ncbi:hypothetical protein [Plantactinospora sonchi]|uniref:Uncharacterized protein n=1 Tax=Plantactinospora sonchi TaxID=1544735 RepID=A0ABU7RYN1_9ACTN